MLNKTIFSLLFLFGLLFPLTTRAIYDPLSAPNNKYGVHILEPSEVVQAARLVNSTGGKWGYVTIPIRTDDRDKNKWVNFMNDCRQNMLVPILRISSYASGPDWVSPPDSELTDFANFLSDLPWPVKNRYIVIYNEPNHSQEWGGYISPSEYAKLLVNANDIFKKKSQDFFLISAGLDMSSPDSATSMDALKYLRGMTAADPRWYASIDGLGAHAYPNPDYRSSVYSTTRYGIVSYRFERLLLKSLGFQNKPLFITETGYLGTDPDFFRTAFEKIWTDSEIVAVTPFVLFAGAGDFEKFSLLNKNHQPTEKYQEIYSAAKTAGSPLLNNENAYSEKNLSYTSGSVGGQPKISILQRIINFFFPPKPTVIIGRQTIKVDLADNQARRTKGLSGRKSLDADSGMLFQFAGPSVQTFWMKEMNFSLDFIWIKDGQVVNIHENIPPPSNSTDRPVVISSVVPITSVLEVNAGYVALHQIRIGDRVMVNLP